MTKFYPVYLPVVIWLLLIYCLPNYCVLHSQTVHPLPSSSSGQSLDTGIALSRTPESGIFRTTTLVDRTSEVILSIKLQTCFYLSVCFFLTRQ